MIHALSAGLLGVEMGLWAFVFLLLAMFRSVVQEGSPRWLEGRVVPINSLVVGPVRASRSPCTPAGHGEPRNPELVGLPKP